MAYEGKGNPSQLLTSSGSSDSSVFTDKINPAISSVGYIPGEYYFFKDVTTSVGSSGNTVANRLYLGLVTIREDISIDEISLLINTPGSAGQKVRCGLYYNISDAPTTVYKDFGLMAVDVSPGVLTVSETIKKGKYFMAVHAEGVFSCRFNSPSTTQTILPILSGFVPSDAISFTGFSFASGLPNLTNQSGTYFSGAPALGFRIA